MISVRRHSSEIKNRINQPNQIPIVQFDEKTPIEQIRASELFLSLFFSLFFVLRPRHQDLVRARV